MPKYWIYNYFLTYQQQDNMQIPSPKQHVSVCCLTSVLNFPRCFSYIGRLGYGQDLSLQRSGCVYHDTVQHEVLHALGFHHEQKRSDRDQYIRILLENVTPGV